MKKVVTVIVVLGLLIGIAGIIYAQNCVLCPFCGLTGWKIGRPVNGLYTYTDTKGHFWQCRW